MEFLKKALLILPVLTACFTHAQDIRVIDNKGTLNTIAKIKHAEFIPTEFLLVNDDTNYGVRNFFGTEIMNEGAVTKTSDSRITIDEQGYYQISFSSFLVSTVGSRGNPEVRLFINGIEGRVGALSAYIRRSSGHDESSWNFTFMGKLNQGDMVELQTRRLAGVASVFVSPTRTSFTITKLGM